MAPLEEAAKAQLSAGGIILLNYVGSNAYFAKVAGKGIGANAVQAAEMAAAYEIDVNWKLHPKVARGEWPEFALFKMPSAVAGLSTKTAETVDFAAFYLIFHPDVSLEKEGVAVVERHGGQVRDVVPSINAVVAWAPLANITELAAEDAVQWLEPPQPQMGAVNDSNRAITQANIVNATPYNLDGTGINVMVYDAGTARATHVDFGGRLSVREPGTMIDHATHVAGTIGGSGLASAGRQYRGMAPGVTIQSYQLDYDGTGTFLYTNPGDIEANYNQAVNTYGAEIANNSLGTNTAYNGFPCSYEGDYGACDMLIDAMVRGSLGAPMRIIWANGNERADGRCGYAYHTTAPPACAKNHITVGAVNSNDDTITWFSSWGPSDDGRLKPDVSGPGSQSDGDGGVTSCFSSSDTAYGVMSGTSMACPTVTGLCALILQDWKVQFPARPLPRNSTLKILLAHNAVDLGNVGPDYQYGYGSVRAQNTIDFMRTGSFREESVVQGEDKYYYVNVPAGAPSLKATLAWDDPPGAANTAPELVNDLDIVAIAPDLGATYYPWTLDPANPANPAVRAQADRRNNLEQVVVDTPVAGRWTIRVRGFAVAQGPQVFSVCATPVFSTATRQGTIQLDRDAYACNGTATITVTDTDLNTDPLTPQTVMVTLGSTTEPAPPGETLLLTETGPDTSVFSASIPLAAVNDPGVLQVSSGDAITAAYQDADDGSGSPDTITDTATVDCQGPVISNVAVSGVSALHATITFDTDELATGLVRYGLSSGSLANLVSGAGLYSNHSISLTGLTPLTQYHLDVKATDGEGNFTTENNGGLYYTFTTTQQPDYFTQFFSSNNNDTDDMTLHFRPDNSQDNYRVCRESATGFPTDPSGGIALDMSDDMYTAVTLTGGQRVSLYGVSHSTFYVGSNGYITFGSGDSSVAASLENHFNLPRISWLFDDLYPGTGQVTWKQLADRAVVTFQNVKEFDTGNSNTAQIELYFNGEITITWLGIDCTHGLAGLSRGTGVPADYLDSDLTGYVECSALSADPPEGFDPSGYMGGPFTPAGKEYTLTNSGAVAIPWTASPTQSWATVSPASGTLSPGASVVVTVAPNENALGLSPGVYEDTVTVSNTLAGTVCNREVSLTVLEPPAPPVLSPEPFASPGTTNQIGWTAVPNAEGYYAEVDDDPSFGSPNDNSGWVPGLTHTFGGLTDGRVCFYRVKARYTMTGIPESSTQTSQLGFESGLTGWSNVVSSLQDATPPTGTVVINGADPYTLDSAVTLTLGSSDGPGSGVAQMQFSNNAADWCAWEGLNTSKSWALDSLSECLKTVYVRYQDTAGNISTDTIIDTIMLDTTAPLIIRCAAGQNVVANDLCQGTVPDFTAGVAATDNCDASLDIAQIPKAGAAVGLGVTSVTITVTDDANNSESCTVPYTVDVPLEPLLPAAPLVYNPAASSLSVSVAADGNSAAIEYSLFCLPSNQWVQAGGSLGAAPVWQTAAAWGTVTVTGLAEYTAYAFGAVARNCNGAETLAGPTPMATTKDVTAPTGTILMNNNQSVTNSSNVTLALAWDDGTGSGAVRMRFSDDGMTWSAWEPLAATRAHTLPGPDGYHTVRVQFRDRAGSNSAAFDDYIRVDTVKPTGSIIINGGALTTTTTSVKLGLAWADNPGGAGVVRMRFSDNGANWTLWEQLAGKPAYTLPAGNGYHTVRVQYRDAGGNISPACNDYIKLVQ